MNGWELPRKASIGGRAYTLHCDFRDILEIFTYFENPDLPEYLRWRIGLALFFGEELPVQYQTEGMAYLSAFLHGGAQEQKAAPRLLDWEQDAAIIVAEVNKVAGQEIRSLPFVHWWTFLAWFHAIGEGQLSALVGIRDKLRRGKKLEGWEKDFYREHRAQVELSKRYSQADLAEQKRLKQLLGEAEAEK